MNRAPAAPTLLALLVVSLSCASAAAEGGGDALTPQRAVELTLSEPLSFVERFYAEPIGLFDEVCIFENSKVLLRVDYCGAPRMGERSGREVVAVEVFTPDGQHARIYAEVKPPKNIKDAQRSEYLMWNVEYHDIPDIVRLKKGSRSKHMVEYFEAKKKLQWGSYTVCFHNKGKFECRGPTTNRTPELLAQGQGFVDAPPAKWFELVKKLDGLIDKHGAKKKRR